MPADEFDLRAGKLLEPCPRTEGVPLIASTDAVLDDDLHLRPPGASIENGAGRR
jgi:hypothetical protein